MGGQTNLAAAKTTILWPLSETIWMSKHQKKKHLSTHTYHDNNIIIIIIIFFIRS